MDEEDDDSQDAGLHELDKPTTNGIQHGDDDH